MTKISKNGNTYSLATGTTAARKMVTGFLARTTLAAWLGGSLGIRSLLFATALKLAADDGSALTYGVVDFKVKSYLHNFYCDTITATATAVNCYGFTETATITVIYDNNGGKTAAKKNGYIPAVKTENSYRIHFIDGVAIDFDGVAISIK